MTFPAGLTMVSVHCKFDLPPSGGSSGVVTFVSTGPLVGPTDNSIVPPFGQSVTLDGTGQGTISLPATNDPDWTPQGWTYQVQAAIGNGANWVTGTLQLDFHTTSVELADLIQVTGAAVAGVSYIPLSLLGAANGVALLDGSSKVLLAEMPDLSGLYLPLARLGVANGAALLDSGTKVPLAEIPDLSGVYLPVASAPILPSDQGFTGWTFDPATVPQASSIMATSGLALVAKIRATAATVSAINFHFPSNTAAGLTAAYAALYNNAGALLAVSNNQAAAESNWATAGYKTCPLITPQVVTPGAFYKVVWWFTGTTGPTLTRSTSSSSALLNANLAAPNFRYATADAGLTGTPPASIGTQTGGPTAWWVGLTP